MTEDKKPWYNDGDKVSGLTATIVLLAVALLIFAGAVKLVTMMF